MVVVMPFTSVKDTENLRRVLKFLSLIDIGHPLPFLLRHALDEARIMTCARYGAIGVLDSARTGLEDFVTVGLTPQEVELIGARPTGKGVLGQLIVDPRPLRISDLRTYPTTGTLPLAHPEMTSFLGVPIAVRQVVYGNFYLTDKVDRPCFTDDDQAVIEALACAVGTAIESTHLRAILAAAALAEERDQRAKDLHDLTIQRLFGLGLKLQSMVGGPTPQQISEELTFAVDRIDAMIDDIRKAIEESDPSTP
jgi:GAF domain-containing protein